MNPVLHKDVVKKVRKFVETVEALKNRKHTYFSITRLTSIKSLCKDPHTAALFTHHLAERTLERVESKACPGHIASEDWAKYKDLIATAVHAMRRHLDQLTDATLSELRKLLPEVEAVQTYSGRQVWGRVIRTIESREVLIIEDALNCILYPHAASELAYKTSRDYAEEYNSRYGTGLIPESVPMLEDIISFWDRYSGGIQDQSPHLLSDMPDTDERAGKRRGSRSTPRGVDNSRNLKTPSGPFEKRYPNVAAWVQDGWIEIGYAQGTGSFIRALDEGGMAWEGKRKYSNVDEALKDAEKGISAWLK